MGYMDEIERAFREILGKGDVEATVRWVKETILQSYRNGQAAPKRAGRTRRSDKSIAPAVA